MDDLFSLGGNSLWETDVDRPDPRGIPLTPSRYCSPDASVHSGDERFGPDSAYTQGVEELPDGDPVFAGCGGECWDTTAVIRPDIFAGPRQTAAGGMAQGGAGWQFTGVSHAGAGGQAQGGAGWQLISHPHVGAGGQAQGGAAVQLHASPHVGAGGQAQGGHVLQYFTGPCPTYVSSVGPYVFQVGDEIVVPLPPGIRPGDLLTVIVMGEVALGDAGIPAHPWVLTHRIPPFLEGDYAALTYQCRYQPDMDDPVLFPMFADIYDNVVAVGCIATRYAADTVVGYFDVLPGPPAYVGPVTPPWNSELVVAVHSLIFNSDPEFPPYVATAPPWLNLLWPLPNNLAIGYVDDWQGGSTGVMEFDYEYPDNLAIVLALWFTCAYDPPTWTQTGAGGQGQGGAGWQSGGLVQTGAGGQGQGGAAAQLTAGPQVAAGGQQQGGRAAQYVGLMQRGAGGQQQGGAAEQHASLVQVGAGGQRQGGAAAQWLSWVQAGVGGQQQGGEGIQVAMQTVFGPSAGDSDDAAMTSPPAGAAVPMSGVGPPQTYVPGSGAPGQVYIDMTDPNNPMLYYGS